jgi:acetyl esterase/lipase
MLTPSLGTKRSVFIAALLLTVSFLSPVAGEDRKPDVTVNLWPGKPPGDEQVTLPEESDETRPADPLIAGKRIIKLANVSRPTLALYRPAADKNNGGAVIICPGGGYNILAYDLEGTEVAEWLNTIGVTGIVVKYRVPARGPDKRYLAAVQDAQRAVSVVRQRAAEWSLDAKRIGLLGFSAGGDAAARTCLMAERLYPPIDDADKVSYRPDFALLIYPGYLAENDGSRLHPDLVVTKSAPPTFLVHAFDDGVTPLSSSLLFTELKKAGVNAELHVFSKGGHGYGLRPTEDPVTRWPAQAAEWMKVSGFLRK